MESHRIFKIDSNEQFILFHLTMKLFHLTMKSAFLKLFSYAIQFPKFMYEFALICILNILSIRSNYIIRPLVEFSK